MDTPASVSAGPLPAGKIPLAAEAGLFVVGLAALALGYGTVVPVVFDMVLR